MNYRNRADAGQRLVAQLRARVPELDGDDTVVLGLAPGGVPVACEIARAIDAPVDVAVALRLSAPGYADLGIGGVATGGTYRLDERTVRMLGIGAAYIEQTVRAVALEAERLAVRYRGGRAPLPVAGRRVILADDGAQTRFRSRAAIAAARARGAREVIYAVPVAASDALESLACEADQVVCDCVPERSCGIGGYYADCEIPRPEEIRSMLARGGIGLPPSPTVRRRRGAETG